MKDNYSDFIMQQAIKATKDDMLYVGKRLAAKNLLVGKGGNYSVRIGEDRILLTASGFEKSEISREHISIIDMKGNLIEGLRPARDIRMHLEVYNSMPEIRAIVHSHCPITTGIAMSNYNFENFLMPEAIMDIGGIEVTDFSVPTTEEVPAVIKKSIQKNPKVRAFVLKGHGALCLSDIDVFDACYKVEYLEAVCQAVLATKIVGSTYTMTDGQYERVMKVLEEISSEK